MLNVIIILAIILVITGFYFYSQTEKLDPTKDIHTKIQSPSIKGRIVHGLGRARPDLGYPTANIRIYPGDYPKTIKLKCGIYLLNCQIPDYPEPLQGYARLNERKSHFFVYLPDLHQNQKKIDLYDREVELSNFHLVSARWIDFIQVYHNFLDLIHGFPYVKTCYF